LKKILYYIKNIFRKKQVELVYLFNLPTATFDEEKKKHEESIRIDVFRFIEKDLISNKKQIEYTDMYLDMKKYMTYYFIASDTIKKCPYMLPTTYEIYSFIKTNIENFSYPMENLIFKIGSREINVKKFTIEC